MKTIISVLAVALVALGGCSNKAIYDNLQHNQRLRCLELPYAQYIECMDGAAKPYEEYQDDLEEAERERQMIENERMLEENEG